MYTRQSIDYRSITKNKKAYYNFFINHEIEAGIVLRGWEIKSLRYHHINLDNCYISFKNKEIYLYGLMIQPLLNNSFYIKDYQRIRKLLLNKHEINFLYGKIKQKNYTIIPLSMYFKNIWIKVKIGLASGKKKIDKRNILKNQDWIRKKENLIKSLK